MLWCGARPGYSFSPPLCRAHIRPMEAVALFAKWNGTKPDAAMLDALGIGGMKKTQYGALSTGQKRRLHLALALTGRPGRGISG